MSDKFWLNKSFDEMSEREWEDLCDGCGKCCLEKIEDEDTGEIYTTCVSCRLLNPNTCQCASYNERFKYMHDCIKLNRINVRTIPWLPKTCSYRLIKEGKDLPNWHPLVTKNKNSTNESGNSVKKFVVHPTAMLKGTTIIDYIIDDLDI